MGARATENPDDVLAVLQTARRLLADGGVLLKDGWQADQKGKRPPQFSMDGALRKGLDLAHPVHRDSAVWAAQHALVEVISRSQTFNDRSLYNGAVVLINFNNHPDTTLADAITVYDSAIRAQGSIKVAVSKAKGRK